MTAGLWVGGASDSGATTATGLDVFMVGCAIGARVGLGMGDVVVFGATVDSGTKTGASIVGGGDTGSIVGAANGNVGAVVPVGMSEEIGKVGAGDDGATVASGTMTKVTEKFSP
jgi:hypothetical protein